jgi:transcriptional regulator of met regulon
VQSYLDSGLIVWYEQLVACAPINGTTAERERRQKNVALHLELNSTLLCKAAVHTMAPAVILVSMAALLWHQVRDRVIAS